MNRNLIFKMIAAFVSLLMKTETSSRWTAIPHTRSSATATTFSTFTVSGLSSEKILCRQSAMLSEQRRMACSNCLNREFKNPAAMLPMLRFF